MAQRISEEYREQLLEKPESGVGYQLVSDGRMLILNASIALCLDDGWRLSREDLRWLFYEYMPLHYNNAEEALGTRLEAEEAVIKQLDLYEGRPGIQVHGSYPSTARSNERFYRYSAFWPDRRIAYDGSVSKGTYATTQNDKGVVPSGLAAVGRYALPNPAPALYEYAIGPIVGQKVWCGTCAPRFGQAGGGVEVRFDQALGAGSASPTPNTIPER